MDLTRTTLIGCKVRLEALGFHHTAQLLTAATYDEIWTYLDEPTPKTTDDIEALIQEAEEDYAKGARVPFAVLDVNSNQVIGSISLIDIQQRNRSVEIGWAWFTPRTWGTGAALEAVFLLMHHAFETMNAVRVAYKTDVRNTRSRKLILKLGATQEGVFRNHRILSDGYIRDSVYYSVTREEWPTVCGTLSTSSG